MLREDALFYNLPCPIPHHHLVGKLDINTLVPTATFCYTKDVNTCQLDSTWVNRTRIGKKENALRLVHDSLARTCLPGNESIYSFYLPTNEERWNGILIWEDCPDATFQIRMGHPDNPFYNLQHVLLEKFHQRRFEAGWHPQVRIWNKKKQIKNFEKIHKVVLQKVKQPKLCIQRITKRKPICIF